jgi:hypothetical protein
MPYSIRTKDGIVLDNIPDGMPKDDPRLKELVSQRRAEMFQSKRQDTRAALKAQSPEEYDPESQAFQQQNSPTAGMSGADAVRANFGAGIANFGMGVGQLALPKFLEKKVGITDEAIDEKRGRDEFLAQNDGMYGSQGLQIAGEAAPAMAIPGGAVARGAKAIPKLGGKLAEWGVGSRAIPTLMAEGAGLGAVSGAITPTKEDESALFNTVTGGLAGAALPGLIGAGKKIASPFMRSTKEEQVAGELGKIMDTSPQAQARLTGAMSQSQRGVGQNQTTAALTQNDELARLENAMRANPETAPKWTDVDESAHVENWTALDNVLGDDASVASAKAATDAYINATKPSVFKRMDKTKLSDGIKDLLAGAKQQLNSSTGTRANWSSEIYNYLREEIKASNRSPDALWNIRKQLREWQEGTPPPGREGQRAPKGDRAIQETVMAIDDVLDRASKGTWSRFMSNMGDHMKRETAQKSGQNIRNALLGEVTGEVRGMASKAGTPRVTRAKLVSLLEKYGKNDFGETLDHGQRDVIDQVVTKMRATEILDRVRASATRGGSQTAPLLASLAKVQGQQLGAGNFTAIASWFSNIARSKRQEILNQILQEPADALTLMRMAEKLKRPLTKPEKALIHAARAITLTPGAVATDGLQSPANEERE